MGGPDGKIFGRDRDVRTVHKEIEYFEMFVLNEIARNDNRRAHTGQPQRMILQ